MREAWSRPGFRENQIAKQRAFFEANPEAREIASIEQRARWNDPEYRARVVAKMTEHANRPEVRAQMSARAKARRKADNFGWSAETTRRKIVDSMRRAWTPERKSLWAERMKRVKRRADGTFEGGQ